jgi:hypothetical protein
MSGAGMVKEGDLVAIFHSIHRVMKAESLLKSQGIAMLLIPAPRALHADCGLGIRYSPEDRTDVERTLEESGLEPEEVYMRSGDGYVHLAAKRENG